MRNSLLMFAVLIMIVSCTKDKNSGGSGIVIKGKISQSSSMKGSGAMVISLQKLSILPMVPLQ